MARSTNGCDTAASVQSKTRVAPDRRRRSTDGSRHGPGSDPVRSRRGAGTTRPRPALSPATGRARPRTAAPAARCPRSSPRPARPGPSATGPAARERPARRSGPATTAGSRRAPRRPRATATRPGHPARRHRGRASASIPGRRRRRSPPAPAPASVRPGPASTTASCRKRSALHLKKASPSDDEARRTTDRPQSWCGRGAPTTGRPSAAIWSTIQVEARSNHPGWDHCGRSGDQPSARSRAQEATAARDVSVPAGRSPPRPGPARSTRPAARSDGVELHHQRDPPFSLLGSFTRGVGGRGHDEPQGRRCLAVSTTSTEARISGRLGSAPLTAASAAREAGGAEAPTVLGGDQDGGASRMRDQQAHLTAPSRLRIGHAPSLPRIPVPDGRPARPGATPARPWTTHQLTGRSGA